MSNDSKKFKQFKSQQKVAKSVTSFNMARNMADVNLTRLQYVCRHCGDNGQARVVRRKENGKTVFKCEICNKVISVEKYEENEVKKSIEVISSIIDYAKIKMGNDEDENTMKLAKELARTQEFIEGKAMKLYKANVSSHKKKKNRIDDGMHVGSPRSN